jgi:hypothetical protein
VEGQLMVTLTGCDGRVDTSTSTTTPTTALVPAQVVPLHTTGIDSIVVPIVAAELTCSVGSSVRGAHATEKTTVMPMMLP